MTTAAEVRRRQRIAVPILAVLYVVVPLAFLGGTVFTQRRAGTEIDWFLFVPPVAVLALGVFLWRRTRLDPSSWPAGGAFFGLVVGLVVVGVVVIRSIVRVGVLDNPTLEYGYTIPFFALPAWLLGRLARRAMTRPLVPELADSRYEWTFRVRGTIEARVDVHLRTLAIVETSFARRGSRSPGSARGERIALTELSRVEAVVIDGAEVRPALPSSIRGKIGAAPGPALSVHCGQKTWIVPVDDADQVAKLIQRRITLARTG